MSISDAQKKASKRWEEKNRERRNIQKKKSAARSFIKNDAVLEDLLELEILIKEKRKEL